MSTDDIGARFRPSLSTMGADAVGVAPHFSDEPFGNEQDGDQHPAQHPHHHHHHHHRHHDGVHGDIVLKPNVAAPAPKHEGFFRRVFKKITSAFHGELD